MAYNITYKKSVKRDLSRIDKTQARKILNSLEKDLSEKAGFFPVLKGHFSGLRKYRIGDYRVIYAIIGEDVVVLRIAHRGDIYKKGHKI